MDVKASEKTKQMEILATPRTPENCLIATKNTARWKQDLGWCSQNLLTVQDNGQRTSPQPQINETHSNTITPLMTFIYTAADVADYNKLTPLLLDKLGKRNSGSRNRLITPAPLFEWAERQAPEETSEAHRNDNASRDQGDNDAEKP